MDGFISTTKAILVSPIFGIVALAGIIGYEIWKGKKDASAFGQKAADLKPAKS